MSGAVARALPLPVPLPPVVDRTVSAVQDTATGVLQDPVGTVTDVVAAPLSPVQALPTPITPVTPAPAPTSSPRTASAAAPVATTASASPAATSPMASTPAAKRAPTVTTTPARSARRPATSPASRAAARRKARRTARVPVAPVTRAVPVAFTPAASTGVRTPAATTAREGGNAVVRTIRDVVEVIPGWVKLLLGLLALLSLALGARVLVSGARGRRLQRQRAVLQGDVDLLEQVLLPDVLDSLGGVGGASVALRPADGPGAGGDFYDAVALPGGRGALILGDLTGHGREALAQTALVRYTLRAYLQAGLSPRLAVQLAGQVLDDQLADGQFATVLVAVHDPGAGTLTYAAAGHPAPILRGCGASEPLGTAFSPAIGVGLRTGLRETTVPFAAGMVACLFTDGLIEARTRSGQLGCDGLGEIVAGLGPEDAAAAVLERVRGAAAETPDDLTVCLLRASGPVAGVRVEELEVDAAAIGGDRARDFLRACGVRAAVADDALFAASAVAAEWGGAVLRVRQGVVDALRPPADIQQAVAGQAL